MYTGPHIVMNGLIFLIDPGDERCFKSGEDVCTDLVQGFLCTGANGTPGTGAHTPNPANFPNYSSIKGGVFNFAGGRGINIEGNLGQPTAFTLEQWYYKLGSGNEYAADGRNNGGGYVFGNYGSYNLNINGTLKYKYSPTYNGADPQYYRVWKHIVLTSDSTGAQWYSDSELKVSGASQDEGLGINYRIGSRYSTTGEWTGYMGPTMIYNRALTAEEVTNNFKVRRERFGI